MKINKTSPEKHPFLQITADISHPPKTLYYIGNLPTERHPTLAIVGTRKPTAYGREVTTRLAGELAKRGVIIVSGLALGVDGIAHQATVEAGGVAIAVLGNPLPDIRPATNRQLAAKILANNGAIISEYGPDDNYTVGKWSFLERNRIVAGLSDAILITEASTHSGTLNTAARALEQGKEVFVVPGNITSPSSQGCNELIKQGAHLATSADDIIEIIAPSTRVAQTSLPLGANQLESDIIALLARGERDGEIIQQTTAADPSEFNVALTMLEINGAIKSLGANQWTLR